VVLAVNPVMDAEIGMFEFPVTLVGETVALVPLPASTSAFTAEYLMVNAEVVPPLALTVAFSVALVAVTFVAAWVVTVGGAVTDSVIWVVTAPAEFWAYTV
jgi:hypothetical protein